MVVKLSAVSQHAIVVPRSDTSLSVFELGDVRPGDVLVFERISLTVTQKVIIAAQRLAAKKHLVEISHVNFTHVAIYVGGRQIIDIMPRQNVRLVDVADLLTNASRVAVLCDLEATIDRDELLAVAEAKRQRIKYADWPSIAKVGHLALLSQHFAHGDDQATCAEFAVALLAEVDERKNGIDPTKPTRSFGDGVDGPPFFPAKLLSKKYIKQNRLKCRFIDGKLLIPPPP
jgi:hypothetical protein